MPRNGSGAYNLPTNSWNPAINGVSATPAEWQALINDVAAAIQASVSADGQTPMSGNLAMGGYRLTGAGAPSGAGMSLRWEQLIQGADIPSSATITIPLEGQYFAVTGSTAITSIAATIAGRLVYLKFAAGIVLTHSTSLIMPAGVNVTTVADDVVVFLSLSSGVWKCVSYPRYEQSGASTYALDTGTANACVVAYIPAITTLTDGLVLRFKVKAANNGATTLDAGPGAIPVLGLGGAALQGGELPANGRALLMYSATATSWILLGCEGGALPVALATKSNHAVNLGQADVRYAALAPVSGQIIQQRSYSDNGTTTASSTPVNVQSAAFVFTPKSTSSRLVVHYQFLGTNTTASGINNICTFYVYESTGAPVQVGTAGSIEAPSGGGGVGILAPCGILVPNLANASLSPRSFLLYASTGSAGTSVGATGISATIIEVKS